MESDTVCLEESLERLICISESHLSTVHYRKLFLAVKYADEAYGIIKRIDPKEMIDENTVPYHDVEGGLQEEDMLIPFSIE